MYQLAMSHMVFQTKQSKNMAKKILPIRVGVSGCLLGEEIRINGQHKRDSFINNILSQYFDFVSICPEVGIGMGVPREPIRLVQVGSKVVAREVTNPTKDFSKPLKNYVKEKKRRFSGVVWLYTKKGLAKLWYGACQVVLR